MPATPAWPPRSLPRLYVRDSLAEGAAVALEPAQANYLGNVMHKSVGDDVLCRLLQPVRPEPVEGLPFFLSCQKARTALRQAPRERL